MEGELLILAVILVVLGVGAWIVERPRSVDAHEDDWRSENGGWR